MPELGAIHDDVQFDWGKAEDLSAELRSTASVLDFQVGERGRIRGSARSSWQGRYGDEFDARVSTCTGDAGRLATSMRGAADDLDELARLAQDEQDRRVQAREWEAAQDNGGGGLFGGVPVLGDVVDTVDDFLTGDDAPPPPPPVDPPSIPIDDPGVVAREAAPAAPVRLYGTGGVSSARPDDLDSWASASQAMDDTLVVRKGTLNDLHSGFTGSLGWGSFDASSMLSAFGRWLGWNQTDGQWVTTIAQTFRDAGAGTVPDSAIDARLAAAGLNTQRTSVTYDDPVAWGEPPTSGYADDPVNTASGNFVETEVDLDAGGLCRLLRYTRTYNSRSDRVGPFGAGWASWASVRLRAEADGAHWVGPDGQEAVVPRAPESANGTAYAHVVGVPGRVVATDDGLALEGLGGGSRMGFDRAGRPLVADDGPGTEVRFRHDGDRLVEMRHAGGRSLTLEWDGDRVVGLRGSDGRVVTYRYDDGGLLVEANGGPRGARRYETDDRGRVVAVADDDGVVEARNLYDPQSRVVAQTSPYGRRTRYRYLPGRVTVVDDDAAGPVNSYVHDDHGRLLGVVDGHGNELTKSYDRRGNPTRVTERDGSTTLMEWDDHARLTRRQAPDGSWFSFTYDELGRVLDVTASTGATTRYRYEGNERSPVELTDPEGGVTRLDVEGGLVRRVIDPDGIEVRYGFDGNGDLISVTDAVGNTALVERDPAGRVTATVSPMGRRTQLVYDEHGRPVERRDAGGGTWRYEWSPAGRPVAVVDPAGGRRELRYGANGAAEQIVDELGHVTTRRFDALGNLVGVVLPDGAKWELDYDRLCRLTAVGDPAGATWLREYDVTGNLVGTIDPVGAHRTTTLDPAGHITAVDDGTTSVAFEHDELGRATVHRRPDGTQAAATYDRCGRVTAVTADDGVTAYEYTPAGRLAAVVSPLGHITRYEHDRCGRRSAVIDPLGRRWALRYDGDGRVTRTIAPTGEATRFRYDDAGHVVARVSSTGGVTRYDHDAAGRLVAVTDPAGGVARYVWDPRGHLVEAIDPNGGITRYVRDVRGFLRSLVDPLGGRIEHRHDPLGRLVERRDQLGRSTRWDYDPAGRLVQRALPTGERVRWWYDGSGRVEAVGTGDEQRVRFERDPLGRPVVVEEPGFRHELAWNSRGRLVARRRNGLGLTWRYDADGRRIAVGYPDGTETTFEHDAAGRPTSATHPVVGSVELEHDGAGRLVRRRLGGRSERWRHRDGALVAHETERHGQRRVTLLERDPAGRVVAATTEGSRVAYAYDAAGQLVGVDGPGGAWTFGYDAAGRLVAETGPDGSTSYRYDAGHQLAERRTGGASVRLGYDRAGRRTTETTPDGSTRRYTWDWLGRLSGVDHTRLAVGALGDLAEIDGMPLLWDPVEAIPQLRWLDGTSLVGDHQGCATVGRDGTVDWLDHDWRGSVADPIGLAGPTGPTGATTRATDPWGAADATATPRLELGYRGELSIDGLLWLRNRPYDPHTRAFLSPDPLPGLAGEPFAANPYHYAGNDPVGALDPLGLRPVTEVQLARYREAMSGNGLFDRAGDAWNTATDWVGDRVDAVTDWVGDNWEYIAAGAMIVGGVVVMATGVGGPIGAAMIGGALLSGGISAGSQRALTGEVDWGRVGVDAAIGGLAGGAGAWAGGTRALTTANPWVRGAVVGAGENVLGGMGTRALYGENPFDPRGIAQDVLVGGGTGGAGGALAARSGRLVAFDTDALVKFDDPGVAAVTRWNDRFVATPNVVDELTNRMEIKNIDDFLGRRSVSQAPGTPGAAVPASGLARQMDGIRPHHGNPGDALNIAEAGGINADLYVTADAGTVGRTFGMEGEIPLPDSGGTTVPFVVVR